MIMTESAKDPSIDAATAALKGMLGLGPKMTDTSSSVPSDNTTASPKQVISGPAAQEPQKDEPNQSEDQQTKKKNNAKKKKNKNKAEEKGNATNNNNNNQSPNTNNNTNNTSSNKQTDDGKKKKQQKKKKESENFAWSAFQSSPDASKLPMPAFYSPATASDNKKTESNNNEATIDNKRDVNPTPVTLDMSERAEREQKNEEPEVPMSKTGINLAAALTEQPVSNRSTSPSSTQQNFVHPTLTSPNHIPPYPYMGSPNITLHHYQQLQPPHLQYPPPSPHMNIHHPPPTPPGYVTIQVQVPPVLLPGRQMVVTSPAGYPVQVVVPNNVLPGMILPVHVPIGPPMHMMPPPSQAGSNNHMFGP